MIIGKAYTASNTLAVKKNGLTQGKTGHVAHVDGFAISIEFAEKDLKAPRELFGLNFTQCDPYAQSPNMVYKRSKHFAKVFRA